jgi:hypothetical protein
VVDPGENAVAVVLHLVQPLLAARGPVYQGGQLGRHELRQRGGTRAAIRKGLGPTRRRPAACGWPGRPRGRLGSNARRDPWRPRPRRAFAPWPRSSARGRRSVRTDRSGPRRRVP